jgi:exportin-2 (importin alpha re-exporter)
MAHQGIMRIIITARTELAPVYTDMMNKLVNILALISKNPSNPNFNQYTFESISALIRFIVPAAPGALQAFESGLLGPMSFILGEDIDRELHPFM